MMEVEALPRSTPRRFRPTSLTPPIPSPLAPRTSYLLCLAPSLPLRNLANSPRPSPHGDPAARAEVSRGPQLRRRQLRGERAAIARRVRSQPRDRHLARAVVDPGGGGRGGGPRAARPAGGGGDPDHGARP